MPTDYAYDENFTPDNLDANQMLREYEQCNFSGFAFTGYQLQGRQLSKASFTDCDLAGAIFDNTNLEQADFRTAIHYAIDPAANRMKKAKFSIDGLPGLLHKYQLDIS